MLRLVWKTDCKIIVRQYGKNPTGVLEVGGSAGEMVRGILGRWVMANVFMGT